MDPFAVGKTWTYAQIGIAMNYAIDLDAQRKASDGSAGKGETEINGNALLRYLGVKK